MSQELDWDTVLANLDRLTEESLSDMAIRIIYILEARSVEMRKK